MDNHVTREEFNGAIGGLRDEQKKHSERLVALETKVDNLPELVYAKIQAMVSSKSEGNFKWTANFIVPALTFVMGLLAMLSATKGPFS